MAVLKQINVVVSFLLEVAMLLALAYWGFHTGQNLGLKLALGLGIPLAAVIIWGLFLAPRAGQRANSTVGVALSLALFYIAGLLLYQAGQPALAAILFVVAAVNRTLVVVWRQW